MDSHPALRGLLLEVMPHVRVWFHADPTYVLATEVTQIRTRSWADLKDGSREPGKEPRLVRGQIAVRPVSAARHKPCEQPLSQRTGAATDARGTNVSVAGIMPQCSHYSAFAPRPP